MKQIMNDRCETVLVANFCPRKQLCGYGITCLGRASLKLLLSLKANARAALIVCLQS